MTTYSCFQKRKQTASEVIIEDLKNQFSHTPHDEVLYTVNLRHIRKRTGTTGKAASAAVRNFLKSKNKNYEHKDSGIAGAKYRFTVSRKEFEEWK